MGEKYFFVLLDDSGTERLRIRIETAKGGVKYFVVQYETYINEDWTAIVRYDLAHGFFHRDVMNYKGEKEKQSITITNLEDALNYAQQDLKDRWEFYKERFLKQMKK
ncbi:MAG: hypothetical protein K2X48_19060 [Chitinophagaceae bacterium]|nr:hypothetical protein [Chitinophagaceae bacterium]